MREAILYVSASLTNKWTNLFSFCWRVARVPLPRYSALKRPTAESDITSLILFSLIIPLASSSIKNWCELLYARATIILSSTFSGSIPLAFAIDTILSGLKVFSLSMYNTPPSNPPSSLDFCTCTHIVWQNCVLPQPNSPYTSVNAWVSTPPSNNVSRQSVPVVIFPISCLFLYNSLALTKSFAINPPSTKPSLAFSQIFDAESTSIPVNSAISTGPLTIRSIILWIPASFNFLVVTGPTPANASNLKSSVIP